MKDNLIDWTMQQIHTLNSELTEPRPQNSKSVTRPTEVLDTIAAVISSPLNPKKAGKDHLTKIEEVQDSDTVQYRTPKTEAQLPHSFWNRR